MTRRPTLPIITPMASVPLALRWAAGTVLLLIAAVHAARLLRPAARSAGLPAGLRAGASGRAWSPHVADAAMAVAMAAMLTAPSAAAMRPLLVAVFAVSLTAYAGLGLRGYVITGSTALWAPLGQCLRCAAMLVMIPAGRRMPGMAMDSGSRTGLPDPRLTLLALTVLLAVLVLSSGRRLSWATRSGRAWQDGGTAQAGCRLLMDVLTLGLLVAMI